MVPLTLGARSMVLDYGRILKMRIHGVTPHMAMLVLTRKYPAPTY